MEVPPDSQAAQAERMQLASRQLTSNGVARHNGDSQPRHDSLFDCFRVAEFHGCVDLSTGSLESALGDLTGG